MDVQQVKQEFAELEKQLQDPAVTSDPRKLKELSQKYNNIKEVGDKISQLDLVNKEIAENEETLKDHDAELVELAEAELLELRDQKQKLENEIYELLNPADPLDQKNAIMEIRAGTGGDESALFAADLCRMYTRYAEKQGWHAKIIDSNRIGIGGYKEVIMEINGRGVYGSLKYESGTHRVQRVPETEKNGRVHTSAATVAVLPEAEEMDLEIKLEDVKVDVYRAGGKGGQSVNTTDSAVRLTHLPTGVVVTCQDERSQLQNKTKAFKILRSRLLAAREEKRRQEVSDMRKNQVGSGDRSEKIRTYNFPQDRITDHRIKSNWFGIMKIMDGDIDEMIQALKAADRE